MSKTVKGERKMADTAAHSAWMKENTVVISIRLQKNTDSADDGSRKQVNTNEKSAADDGGAFQFVFVSIFVSIFATGNRSKVYTFVTF